LKLKRGMTGFLYEWHSWENLAEVTANVEITNSVVINVRFIGLDLTAQPTPSAREPTVPPLER
jgi:hypothetical protein